MIFPEGQLAKAIAVFRVPRAAAWKLRHPDLVSFAMLANLYTMRHRYGMQGLDAIVDVGANTGQFAFMASRVWPGINVHSVEPDPDSFAVLERNMRRLKVPGVRLCSAISDIEGDATLLVHPDKARNSILPTLADNEGAAAMKVPATMLDSWVPRLPKMRNPLLKLDIQGGELSALRSARRVLREFPWILTEVAVQPSYAGQPLAGELMMTLEQEGFRMIEIIDVLRARSRRGHPIIELDILFARED